MQYVVEGNTEGRIEVTGRRGRRGKQLLVDFKEKRGYCKLKDEALDRSLWRTGCGRVCGTVLRQTVEWMKEHHSAPFPQKTQSITITNTRRRTVVKEILLVHFVHSTHILAG